MQAPQWTQCGSASGVRTRNAHNGEIDAPTNGGDAGDLGCQGPTGGREKASVGDTVNRLDAEPWQLDLSGLPFMSFLDAARGSAACSVTATTAAAGSSHQRPATTGRDRR